MHTANIQTSLAVVKRRKLIDSGDIHLMGRRVTEALGKERGLQEVFREDRFQTIQKHSLFPGDSRTFGHRTTAFFSGTLASATPPGTKQWPECPPHLCNSPPPQCIGKGQSLPASRTQRRPPGCFGRQCPWKKIQGGDSECFRETDREVDRETKKSAGQGPSLWSTVRQLLSVSPSPTP